MDDNTKNSSLFSKVNNLNFIRLLAALQVVVLHAVEY